MKAAARVLPLADAAPWAEKEALWTSHVCSCFLGFLYFFSFVCVCVCVLLDPILAQDPLI